MDLIDLIAWIVLGVFFGTAFTLNCLGRRWSRQQTAQQAAEEAAERERFGGWICPHCNLPYGERVHITRCGPPRRGEEAGFPIEGKLFVMDAALICPLCQWMAIYDAKGYSPPVMQGHLSPESVELE